MTKRLADHRYISLTTNRRDGTPVSTPVWVVSDDGERLLVWTAADSGKAKRVRGNPRVQVAPCDMRGRETAPRAAGDARILGPEAEPIVVELLRRKYGIQKRGLEAYAAVQRRLGGTPTPQVIIEVRRAEA